jgi:hypothetical protein
MVTDRSLAPRQADLAVDDPIDPHLVLEANFEEPPTVGLLIAALLAMPMHLPVFVNGEGWVSAIEVLDPTVCEPFREIVYEPHVVIG